jgi:integrase
MAFTLAPSETPTALDGDSTVAEVVGSYLSYLRSRNRASTAEKYRPIQQLYSEWAGDRPIDGGIEARAIQLDFLPRWLDGYEQYYGKPPADNTRRNQIQGLRSLYNWAIKMDYVTGANPMLKIETVKVEARVRDWLRQDELDELIEASVRPHERFVVAWFAFSGCRVEEAQNVRVCDIDLVTGKGEITVRKTKTNNGMRTIPLHPRLRPEITKRIRELRSKGFTDDRTPILATRNGTAMSGQQLGQIVQRVTRRTGIIKTVNPQMLRRTYGSLLLNQKLRIEVVSKFLGHRDVRVTQRYYAELLDKGAAEEFYEAVG